MKKNVGKIDKILRVIIGLVAAYFAYQGGFDAAWKETVLWIIAVIMMLTAIVGTCPIYSVIGMKTNK